MGNAIENAGFDPSLPENRGNDDQLVIVSYVWGFDAVFFAAECRRVRLELELTQEEVDFLIDRKRTAHNVERPESSDSHVYMSTFLALCNLYDLDPRHFWILEF